MSNFERIELERLAASFDARASGCERTAERHLKLGDTLAHIVSMARADAYRTAALDARGAAASMGPT